MESVHVGFWSSEMGCKATGGKVTVRNNQDIERDTIGEETWGSILE